MKTLRDAFPDWMEEGGGIFYYITLPVPSVLYDKSDLDYDYYGNVSGAKIVSPLVNSLIGDEDSLTTLAMQKLGRVITWKYKENWDRLWQSYVIDYDPISPYNIDTTSTETHNLTIADSGSSASNGSETTQTAYGKTDTITHGKVTTTEHDVYGFNSQTATPSSVDTATESGTTTDRLGGTDQSNTAYSDGRTDSNTRTDTGTLGTVGHRAGNLGLLTKQRLLEEEHKLWAWNFFKQVYKDLDEVLTIPFYDLCQL